VVMDRALLRLLRTSAFRGAASRSSARFLEPVALRIRPQILRHFVAAVDRISSDIELRGYRAYPKRVIWEGWNSRGFASEAGPGEVVVPFMGDSISDGNLAEIFKSEHSLTVGNLCSVGLRPPPCL
jgi:hypothetical protein